MREIKFRVWTGNKMCHSDDALQGSNGHLELVTIYTGYEDSDEWDNYEFMQYTGLKDKNGTEIYEGDILQLTGKAKYNRRVVGFKNGIFGYADHNDNWISLKKGFEFSPEDHGCPKVVGNIHENPELLEQEVV